MINRRTFIKTSAAAGTAMLLNPFDALSSQFNPLSTFFAVHPFIEEHPDAVQ